MRNERLTILAWLFCAIAFFNISVIAGAQSANTPQLPAKTKVYLPKSIHKMGGKGMLREDRALEIAQGNTYGQEKEQEQKAYWVVYSDREHNPCYSTSSGNAVCAYLDFNQRVTIAQIDNKTGRALVFEDKKLRTWPDLPPHGEYTCYGWISLDKLLLWDSCPTDEHNIYHKALLSVNIDASSKASDKDAALMYKDPDASKTYPLKLDEHIYFIMKRSGDKVLLSRQYTLSGSASYKVLLGWVKPISYVAWSQRSCLEPTWDPDDVEFFAKNNISAEVTPAVNSKVRASAWDFRKNSLAMKDKNDVKYNGHAENLYRVPGNFRRFPILGRDKDSGKYNVTSFSRAGKTSMDVDFDSWGLANEDLEKLQHVNLVLVIDGTKSMEKFYDPVRKGIEDGCRNLAKLPRAKIKVGAVIYRDKADVKGGRSFEVEKLQRLVKVDDKSFIDFLASGGEYGIRSSGADKTLEESLYRGIEEGLTYLKGKEKESNIMLVVGDCGNVRDDEIKNRLIAELAASNVQLMGYQVRIEQGNGRFGSYISFTDQMFDLVSEAIKGIYRAQNRPDSYATFQLKGNRYAMTELKNRTHQGSVMSPLDGSVMNGEELSNYLFSTISEAQSAIQHQLDLITNAAYGEWDADPEYLKSRGLNPASFKNTLSFQGWTSLTGSNGRDFYKPVLFLSSEEFMSLLSEMGAVADVASNPDRLAYVNAMKAIAMRHAGLSSEEAEELSDSQIQHLIYDGLVEKSATLANKRRPLKFYLDLKTVPEAEFQRVLKEFANKYKRLRRINEDYQGFYQFNGAKYYWIPIEDLP